MANQNMNKITLNNWLQSGLIRLCRIHFAFVATYVVYIIASDATNLIVPKVVLQRWTTAAVLLVGTSILWYLARGNVKNSNYYRSLISLLIVLDIGLATFSIYTQRGMASRAVILFAVPIVVSSVLLSRTAIFLVATLSATAYSLAAVKYFVDFFNEGYKAELYIEVGFYCVTFYILAAVLNVMIRFKTEPNTGL